MSVKPQYETYRYTDGLVTLRSQSMVECRLAGSEIGSILAVQATAIPTECVCVDGEVQYKGKAVLCIVYEDGDGKVCRVERGIEFFHKAEGREVTPACFAKTAFTVVNVTHRREGSGLYVTAIIDAVSDVYGSRQIEFLVGGENLVTRSGSFTVCKTVCVSGETEGEDEFETDYVGDIVLHGETVIVTRAVASGGQIDVEGEITLGVCALKSDDGVCSYERIVPFSMQIPCEEAFGKVTCCARVQVKSATLSAGVDEDKGVSKVVFAYALLADCYLSRTEEISAVDDAFCLTRETGLMKGYGEGRYVVKQEKYVERISGTATFANPLEPEFVLETAVLPRAETVCKKSEQGIAIFSYISFLGAIYLIYNILKEFGICIRKRLWAIFSFSSFALVAILAYTPCADIFIGSLILSGIYLFLVFLKENDKTAFYFSTLSIALASGSKTTAIIVIPSIAIMFAIITFKYKKEYFWKITFSYTGLLILNFLIFSSYNYILNFIELCPFSSPKNSPSKNTIVNTQSS